MSPNCAYFNRFFSELPHNRSIFPLAERGSNPDTGVRSEVIYDISLEDRRDTRNLA
jgi:hypothetical protein